MRKLTLITVTALLALTVLATLSYAAASAKQATFQPPLTWRADDAGQYKFKSNVSLSKSTIAADGSVTSASGGTCELETPYTTTGKISKITANWTFTGAVTMEVSATGNDEDYTAITNGVPLVSDKFTTGANLKWRATLGAGSTLSEVRIAYADASGVVGTFGNPDLSGFDKRKKIAIKGSTGGALYNYQVQVKVGESQKASGCDFYLDSLSKADLMDIRFTQADGETLLPYFRESITGTAPNRVATFWVRIPEIPKEGLPIYVYYACAGASDLSNPEKVFDFYDDFNRTSIDSAKWKVVLADKTSQATVSSSTLTLDAARATTTSYNFTNGIIEYRAKMTGNGNISVIIAEGASADRDLTACASIIAASANCIKLGEKILANYPKQITLDTYYDFKLTETPGGDLTFQRYADGWSAMQATVLYSLGASQAAKPVGLSVGTQGTGLVCDWIRTRQYAAVPALVDTVTTASTKEETPNLPKFDKLILNGAGYVILEPSATTGTYTSQLITTPFQARILTASWTESAPDDNPIKVSVSTNKGTDYVADWSNATSKYASKKEFTKGDKLRWKTVIASKAKQSPSLSKFTLSFQPGTIKIVTPTGGENIVPGSVYDILWETKGYEPTYEMDISYSNDGGATFQPIATKVANTGNYMWMAPADESANCMIMVADSADNTIYGLSDNNFSVTTATTSALTSEAATASTAASETAATEAALAAAAAATATTQAATTTATASTAASSGLQLYDILVKSGSIPTTGKGAVKTSAGVFQDGDIVTIKPAGSIWGAAERANFTIVQAYLTPAEVTELTSPQEKIKAKDRKTGQSVKELVRVRKHKVDLTKSGALGKSVTPGTQLITGKALVDKSE